MDSWAVSTCDGYEWNRIYRVCWENDFIFNDLTPTFCIISSFTIRTKWKTRRTCFCVLFYFAWLFGSFTRPTRHGLITMFSILSTRSTLTTSTTAYTRWHSCKIIGRHSLWSKNNSNNNIDVTTCENTCLGCKRVHVQYIRTTGSPLRMCSLESKIDKKSEKHAGADDRTSAPTINRRKSCAKWISGRLGRPTGWTYVRVRCSWQEKKKIWRRRLATIYS